MNHVTEEQLILRYYGEENDATVEPHLAECEACRFLNASIQRTLNEMDAAPVPEQDAGYEEKVWRRIEGKLGRRRWTLLGGSGRWAAAIAMAILLVGAFLAGRHYPERTARDPQAAERVLLVAVGDYLDRSQMVLVELANADGKGPIDISSEQERAHDLVSESRLYKQTAMSMGNASVAGILEELEPVLLEIAHGPSRLSPEELERLRARLEAEGILFKIRVVNSNVRNQETGGLGKKL